MALHDMAFLARRVASVVSGAWSGIAAILLNIDGVVTCHTVAPCRYSEAPAGPAPQARIGREAHHARYPIQFPTMPADEFERYLDTAKASRARVMCFTCVRTRNVGRPSRVATGIRRPITV
jgi:hypothetical protein